MATSLRTLARESLFAMIVAYLREGAVSTANFSNYPSAQRVYTFSLGDDLWQVALMDAAQEPLPIGVTVQFAADVADASKAMPQLWTVPVRIHVRMPRDWRGESLAHEIAQQVDEALYRANGRIEITDYDAVPVTPQGTFLTWQRTERGTWEAQGNELVDALTLSFEVQYGTANL